MMEMFYFVSLIVLSLSLAAFGNYCYVKFEDGKLVRKGNCQGMKDNPVIRELDERQKERNCNKHLDLIFVVDGSGSIGVENFNRTKAWLINETLRIYKSFGRCANVEVLQYSNKDRPTLRLPIKDSKKFAIPFVLGECVMDEKCVTERINNMPYLEGQTFTYYALRRVMEAEFPKWSKHYSESAKIVVVLTDGIANDGTDLKSWYNKYKHEVTPFALGIGNGYNINELRDIANGDTGNERVFTLSDFGNLNQFNLTKEIKRVVGN